MTTYFQTTVDCAACGKSSEHTVLGSTNAFGSPDLDLRPPPMQRHTMGTWLQECPHCGYIAPSLSHLHGDPTQVGTEAFRAIRTDERYANLARRFLAHALLLQGDPARSAQAYLHAAWCCDDARQETLARECRLRAADQFERTRPFTGSDEAVMRGALLVDVLRRAGNLEAADRQCAELLATELPAIVRQVLTFQRTRISASDTGLYTVQQAVEGSDS